MERSGVVNVYINELGPRASWIFRLIFEDLLGLSLHLTTDRSELGEWGGAALNYSTEYIEGIPALEPFGLLRQDDIRQQQVRVTDHNGLPVFFEVSGGDLPFDPFSMAFYLVSRYEEYLPFEADKHGRFMHTQSLAYREGFLGKALVNHLAELIRQLLSKHYPDIRPGERAYHFIPTFDIDIAYAHLGKGAFRATGAMAKLLLKGNVREILARSMTMTGLCDDPYDNFDLILDQCSKYDLAPVFFILAGDRSRQDRNLSLANKRFASLVRKLQEQAEIGVHPSYLSGTEPHRIAMEMERISRVTGQEVDLSRQHFLKLRMPDTYQHLISAGINKDFSMGYAGAPGFRASIASPFKFYNLSREEASSLEIIPFMFMDTTLSDYMRLEPLDYFQNVKAVIDEVKACKGQLSAIWHNYAMADDAGKQQAFKQILKYAATL